MKIELIKFTEGLVVGWEVEVTRFLVWTTENVGYHLLRWGRYEAGASFVEKNDDLDLL